MIKTTALAVSLALILSACIPAIPLPFFASATPLADNSQAADAALTATAIPTAIASSPTPTKITASETAEPTGTISETMISNTQFSETQTAVQATIDFVSTEAQETLTVTGTPAYTSTAGSSTIPLATETLHPRFFGTLPPAIPSGKILLINKAKADVYISMQCTTKDGSKSILEYPISSPMKVSAPAGKYSFVVWSGGRQLLGTFGLDTQEEITITVYKDRVTIK
jgi:hypothetical protein